MKRHVLVLSILLLAASAAALAETTSVRSCIAEARDELQSCSIECINDFRNERFNCRNVEPGCGRECLGRREGCIETATEPLVVCAGVCREALIDAKAALHTDNGPPLPTNGSRRKKDGKSETNLLIDPLPRSHFAEHSFESLDPAQGIFNLCQGSDELGRIRRKIL